MCAKKESEVLGKNAPVPSLAGIRPLPSADDCQYVGRKAADMRSLALYICRKPDGAACERGCYSEAHGLCVVREN